MLPTTRLPPALIRSTSTPTQRGGNAKFYDAATDGNIITQIDITDGNSSANFWYYDEKTGDWTITASDATPTPDGATGIGDATDGLHVNPGPAAGIVISPDDATINAGGTQAYTAEAADAYGNEVGDVTGGTAFAILEGGHGGSWGEDG